MKNFKQECKSAVALTLVIMLLFSMMSGCLTLSASADEVVFPKVLNKPTVVYGGLDDDYFNNYSYCHLSSYGANYLFNDVVTVLLDDTESDYKLESIVDVSFRYFYEPSNRDASFSTDFKTVEDFGTVLVGIDSSELFRRLNYENWEFNGYDYLYELGYSRFIRETKDAEMSLTVTYADGKEQVVPLNAVVSNKKVSMSVVEKEDGTGYESEYVESNEKDVDTYYSPGTLDMALIRLAHSQNIDSESIMELEKAIFSMEKGESTNRYYVDIDSKEDVVLPMYTMSDIAELVQTRVGNDVVYNTGAAIDFANSAIDALPGENAPIGKAYSFKQSYKSGDTMVTEDRLFFEGDESATTLLALEMVGTHNGDYNNGWNRGRWIQVGDEMKYYSIADVMNLDSSQLIDIVANGSYVIARIKNSATVDYGSEMGWSQAYCLNMDDVKRVCEDEDTLNAFVQDLCSVLTDDYESCMLGYQRYYSWNYCNISSDINELKEFMQFAVNGAATSFQISFTSTGEVKELAELLEGYNINIDYGSNYNKVLVFKYENIGESLEFKEEGEQQLKSIIDRATYGRSHSSEKYLNNSGYTDGEYNNVIREGLLRDTESEIITDTYDGKEVRFSPKMLQSCEKGVVYNVINQVRLSSYDDSPLNFSGYDRANNNWINDGSVFYLDGELIRSYDYNYSRETSGYYHLDYFDWSTSESVDEMRAIFRNTEYKWGELVLASKPDPVQELTFNDNSSTDETITLTWTKPVDEGFGVDENGETRIDENVNETDVIRVNTYTVDIYDEDSTDSETPVYHEVITRDENDDVSLDVTELVKKGRHYRAVVIATNILGDSTEEETEIYIPIPSVEITMTPDQPVYREDDTVVYTETVTNTGKVKLTNVTVTQTQPGEYEAIETEKDEKGDIKVDENDPTKVVIPDLEPGESYTFIYKVPASQHEDNELIDKADVTTDQKVTDDDEAKVRVIHPQIDLIKTVDKKVYKEDETVTYTDVIVNTGDTPLRNVVVTEDNDKGEFHISEDDIPNIETTDENNVVIIKEIPVGGSVTLTYTIKVKDVQRDENNHVVSQTTADVSSEKDVNAKASVEYDIIHPAI